MQEIIDLLTRLAAIPEQIEELGNVLTGGFVWVWLWGLITTGYAYATKWRAERTLEELREIKTLLLSGGRPSGTSRGGPREI